MSIVWVEVATRSACTRIVAEPLLPCGSLRFKAPEAGARLGVILLADGASDDRS